MKAFDEYRKKYKNILNWLPEYLECNFNKIEDYGHLFENHLNKDDAFLIKRCCKKRINASTFIGNSDEIVKHLHQALIDNKEEIAEYLADATYGTDCYEIECELGSLKGKIFYFDSQVHDWSEGAKECYGIRMIIQKKVKSNEFFIKTVFPY